MVELALQAKECGVSLPNINITDAIDTNLPEEEQWDSANSLWTQLRDAWVVEADRRGVNLPTSTPILGELCHIQINNQLKFMSLVVWQDHEYN